MYNAQNLFTFVLRDVHCRKIISLKLINQARLYLKRRKYGDEFMIVIVDEKIVSIKNRS